jgi:Peptidase M60, enhancin and enhancin-like/N-terminal domain of M60-like peptidases/Cadherin domain/Bacterial Ig domain/PA14 domain
MSKLSMMIRPALAAVILAAGLCAACADIGAYYAALTAGLTNVPGSGGTPGTVVMHGRTAFPVFTENTNGTAPVVAAGHWNDDTNAGRGLAYSHTGWTSTTGDMGLGMSNALRWAARGKPNAVIAKGASVSTTFINSLGYTVKTVDTTMATPNTDLTGVDVFLMNGQSDYASGAVMKITNFLAAGGGVLVFSTPWAASSAALADANTVLCGVGLTFSGDYNSGGPFPVPATAYPSYVSALIGLDLLLAQRAGTTNVAVSIQQAAADGIDGVLAVRPLFPPLTNGLAQLLTTYGGFISVNAGRTLTKANAPIESLCERYQSGVFDLTPAALLPKHPDADDFPGAVATNAPVVNKTVIVQGNAPPDDPALINQGSHGTRQPVGLYARAGTVVRVKIPADKVGARLRIQIGHHHDVNFHIDSWHRHPKVVRYEPLTNVVNEVGSPYGGLILMRVPPDSLLGDFPITIEGAVEAPHFEQGVDSPADWARLKSLPGAQGYIRSTNFTAYVSRDALQGVADPTVPMNHWGNVIATSDHYMGYLRRFREEAGKTDRDIIAGGGHAGYPFVMAYGRDNGELVNGIVSNGDWGFYHELGHTYQDNGHGWNSTAGGEVDVNIIPNLLMTLVHKRSLWDNNTHSTMDAANRASGRATLFATPLGQRSWFDVNGGDVAGYDFFFNLPESFGYDLWRRAFSRFFRWSTNNASEPSFAGLDRYNRWFVAMCEETGYNLAPYFDNYGWTNVTPAVKSRFTALPTWSENRPPTSLNLPAPITLSEATPAGTLVATFTATDPDPGNLFIYSILSGNEDGAFTLDRWSGELRVASLDYERKANYVLTVTVFDNALPRYFLTNTLAITVTNLSEPPTLSTPLLVASNSMAGGTVLGSITAAADTGRTISSFGLVSGNPVFAVNAANGQVTLQQPGPLPNPGARTLLVRATDSGGLSATGCVQVLCNFPTGLREQRWNGSVAGGATTFDGLTNVWPSVNLGDNYVRRLSAWLMPPQTGSYTFWVTGSDRATLYLGSNASSSSLVQLCTGASTGVGSFDADASQRSAPFWLEAGKLYALEVIQNEGTGSDYAQAAWQGPGVPARELIPASALIPGNDLFLPPGAGLGAVLGVNLRFGSDPAIEPAYFVVPGPITFNADVVGDAGAITNVQFFESPHYAFGQDNTYPFRVTFSGFNGGLYNFQAVARDRLGNVFYSPPRLVNMYLSLTTNTLVASNATWRYFDQGQNLGTAWREVAFNDNGWSNGAARLGFGGQGEATTINGGPSGARFPTTYFRRAVVITNLAEFVEFRLGVARDDGAVVHVNGIEVFRTGMNPGTVTYSTLAINASDVQTFFSTNLPPTVFREGTNIVAVEVHQTSAGSSDLGFALKLEGTRGLTQWRAMITSPAPNATIRQPATLMVSAQATGRDAPVTNITVLADGVVLGSIAGAQGSVAWHAPASGSYNLEARATNALGKPSFSPLSPVTIIPNNPPSVALLTAGGTVTNPPMLFIDASAADGDDLVSTVELFDGATSLGTLTGPLYTWLFPAPALGLHTLRAVAKDNHGLTSTSAPVFFNVVAAPLVTNLTLVASNSLWKYNDEGVSIGNTWTNVSFNDAAWSNGVARLGLGGDGEITTLRGQPRITYYFRRSFVVPPDFTGTNVTLRLSRDDGAVVYLNGMEVVRDNMPAGAISYTTRPSATVSAPNEQAFFTFTTNASALRDGTNLIAAEVHQIDGSSSDLGFNLELSSTGLWTAVNGPPPLLNLEFLSASQLRLFFADVDGLAYAVEGSTNLPVWFPVTTNLVSGGVFQYFPSATNPTIQFFRVRRVP